MEISVGDVMYAEYIDEYLTVAQYDPETGNVIGIVLTHDSADRYRSVSSHQSRLLLECPDPENQVDRGVEYLDRVSPGWVDRVDPDDLVMWDSCRCVLGQLFGNYVNGEVVLADYYGVDESEAELIAVQFGFFSPNDRYDPLHDAWVSRIRDYKE